MRISISLCSLATLLCESNVSVLLQASLPCIKRPHRSRYMHLGGDVLAVLDHISRSGLFDLALVVPREFTRQAPVAQGKPYGANVDSLLRSSVCSEHVSIVSAAFRGCRFVRLPLPGEHALSVHARMHSTCNRLIHL